MTEALAEGSRLRGQAQEALPGDLTKWSEALGAAKRAQGLLNEGEADGALRYQVAVALADLEREQAVALQRANELERDRKLLKELETIRAERGDHFDWKRTDAEYQAAFRTLDIDADKPLPEEAARRIACRSAPVELTSFVDDWARVRRNATGKNESSWRSLLAVAKAADPDPWRNTVRDHLAAANPELILRLADDETGLGAQPTMSLVLLAQALLDQGDRKWSRTVLERAWRASPGDFWVNSEFARSGWDGESFDKPEEAVRFFSAAVSVRPRSSGAHNNLGMALKDHGKPDEAIAEFREAPRLRPNYQIPYQPWDRPSRPGKTGPGDRRVP